MENGTQPHETIDEKPSVISPLCRAFLRQDWDSIHPRLAEWLNVLKRVGATECWHKKSTFYAHLYETYKISKLWGFQDILAETMLFHSAYSNSYVNLAIFKESSDRPWLSSLVGPQTEELIHLFCTIPRHELIYERLLKVLPDDGLHIPLEGINVPHIHTGEPLYLPHNIVAVLVAFTMVDFCEQLMSWQDQMFENHDGKLHYAGHNAHVLWPAAMKPGLYHAALSRMGRLLRNAHAAVASTPQQTTAQMQQPSSADGPQAATTNGDTSTDGNHSSSANRGDWSHIPLPPLPPVYDSCTVLVTEKDERRCRDLYVEVTTSHLTEPGHAEEAKKKLDEACKLNPHVAEPHLLLAQLALQRQDWDAAESEATEGLRLLATWGTTWDKRMAWEAWVAWARVMLQAASTRSWPEQERPMGMLNLGLVQ